MIWTEQTMQECKTDLKRWNRSTMIWPLIYWSSLHNRDIKRTACSQIQKNNFQVEYRKISLFRKKCEPLRSPPAIWL